MMPQNHLTFTPVSQAWGRKAHFSGANSNPPTLLNILFQKCDLYKTILVSHGKSLLPDPPLNFHNSLQPPRLTTANLSWAPKESGVGS